MPTNLVPLLHQLLSAQPPAVAEASTLAAWQPVLSRLARDWPDPALRAICAGFVAPELAFAFAAGYQAALEQLTGHADPRHFYALCVTEKSGNRPRDIQTRLSATTEGWVLNGEKTYVTGAESADHLLVAATRGEDDNGRPRISLVRLTVPRKGISLTTLPALPFVPQIPHACVRFDEVPVTATDILSGDGYQDYVKPFRTIEDIHVELAICGHLLRQVPRATDHQGLLSCLLVGLATLLTLSRLPALDPATHLMLAGQRTQLTDWLNDIEPFWAEHNPAFYQRWQRDKALLNVAGTAREQRTQRAWQQLLGDSPE